MKELSVFIDRNYDFFMQYNRIVVYYDNGQIELSSILNVIFSAHLSHVEFRKAIPQKHKLFKRWTYKDLKSMTHKYMRQHYFEEEK